MLHFSLCAGVDTALAARAQKHIQLTRIGCFGLAPIKTLRRVHIHRSQMLALLIPCTCNFRKRASQILEYSFALLCSAFYTTSSNVKSTSWHVFKWPTNGYIIWPQTIPNAVWPHTQMRPQQLTDTHTRARSLARLG